MKADKIKLALEKLKEAKVKKVRNIDAQATPLSLNSKDIVNYHSMDIAAKDVMLK